MGGASLAVWASAWSLALTVPLEAMPPATELPPVRATTPTPAALHWKRMHLGGVCDAERGELRLTARLSLDVAAAQRLQLTLHPALRVTAVSWRGKPVPFTRVDARIELPELQPDRTGELVLAYQGRPQSLSEGLTTQDVTARLAVLRPEGQWWPGVSGQASPASEVDIQWSRDWQVVPLEPAAGAGGVLKFAPGKPPGILAGRYQPVSFAGCEAHFFEPAPAAAARKAVRAFWQARRVPLGTGARPWAWFELPPGYAPATWPAGVASRRAPGGDAAALNALIWLPRQGEAALEPERIWLTESLAAAVAHWMKAPTAAPAARLRGHEQAYGNFLQRAPNADCSMQRAWQADASAWEALVQDKGGMAWALLADALGAEGFVTLLRDWARLRQGGEGRWGDFLTLVPPQAGLLRSWVEQPGLPVLRFEDVRQEALPGGIWQVSGVLRQVRGPFGLSTDLVLVTAGEVQRVPFSTFAVQTPFHFLSRSRPLRLVLDGAERAPIQRREHLRVSEAVANPQSVIVYGTAGDPALQAATQRQAQQLAQQLQARDGIARAIYPDDALPAEARNGPLVVLGTPGVNQVTAALRDQFPVRFLSGSTERLWWQGRTWAASDHGVVQVIANPSAPQHTLVLLAGLTPRAQEEALRYLDRASTYCLYGPQGVNEGMALRAFPDLEYPLY